MVAISRTYRGFRNPRELLIEMNVCWLRQVLELLERIDADAFTRSPAGLPRHRAGAHLRHILEFYDCFLDGMESHHIDYDARPRNMLLERSPEAAAAHIRGTIGRLYDAWPHDEDRIVMVRLEDADDLRVSGGWLPSSVSRELQALSSHTIHHFALIAMTLHSLGIEVDPDFGVAPSTLSHESKTLRTAKAV